MSNSSKAADDALNNNNVGPIVRAGKLADAIVEAAEIDNPDREITVQDKLAYLRIFTETELILKRTTIEECLGENFEMQDLEIQMSSFAGRIETTTETARFYFNKTL